MTLAEFLQARFDEEGESFRALLNDRLIDDESSDAVRRALALPYVWHPDYRREWKP